MTQKLSRTMATRLQEGDALLAHQHHLLPVLAVLELGVDRIAIALHRILPASPSNSRSNPNRSLDLSCLALVSGKKGRAFTFHPLTRSVSDRILDSWSDHINQNK
jgi:hypothetical protein